jgi:hypothetical protein
MNRSDTGLENIDRTENKYIVKFENDISLITRLR